MSILCNIYIPEQNMNEILNQISSPFIILGDFNAHYTIWGSEYISCRGQVIEDILLKTPNKSLLNDGQSKHVTLANGKLSAIDLSFSSATISPTLNWEVHPDLNLSDHFKTDKYEIRGKSAGPSLLNLSKSERRTWNG